MNDGKLVCIVGNRGALQEVPEVMDGAVDGEELPVEGDLLYLSGSMFPAVE